MTFTIDKVNPGVPPAEVALWKAIPILSDLVNDANFLASHVLPLVEEPAEDWYVAYCQDDPEHSYSVQVFVWPPGSATRVHDHSSWGAFCCVVGSVLEERYERLDDGSRPDHAHLKKIWQLLWSREDGASRVLPHDGGIHRVGNPSHAWRSRCTCTGLGWERWTVGTTTSPATTSVTGGKIRRWSDARRLTPGLRAAYRDL